MSSASTGVAGVPSVRSLLSPSPQIPATRDDHPFLRSIAGLATRAGDALSSMLRSGSGNAAVVDALTAVDPDIATRMQSASDRYQLATDILARAGRTRTTGAHAGPDVATLSETDIAHVQAEQRAAEREMYELAARDAETRLARVSQALAGQFTAGSKLPMIARMGIDPSTYAPRDEAEAQAFAERLTIDMVTGVAQLDALRAEWQRAKAESPGSPELAMLQRRYQQHYAWVERLIAAYEKHTGGTVGQTALAGNRAQDIAGLRQAGDELDQTGHSTTADGMQRTLMRVIFDAFKMIADSNRRIAEQERQFQEEMRRSDEKAAERHAQAEASLEQALVRRAAIEAAWRQRHPGG